MPDPVDPTPVSIRKEGDVFVVVDKHGHRLAGQDPLPDSERASAIAARVNATWAGAKSERTAKGGPAITEAWSDEARAAALVARRAGRTSATSLDGLEPGPARDAAIRARHKEWKAKFGEHHAVLGSMKPGETREFESMAGHRTAVTKRPDGKFDLHHKDGRHEKLSQRQAAKGSAWGPREARINGTAKDAANEAWLKLAEALGDLTEALDESLQFNPAQHRRTRSGEFAAMLGKLKNVGDRVDLTPKISAERRTDYKGRHIVTVSRGNSILGNYEPTEHDLKRAARRAQVSHLSSEGESHLRPRSGFNAGADDWKDPERGRREVERVRGEIKALDGHATEEQISKLFAKLQVIDRHAHTWTGGEGTHTDDLRKALRNLQRLKQSAGAPAFFESAEVPEALWQLDEALGELDEALVPFIPHREGAMQVHFDPRLHPRDRVGEFRNLVGSMQRRRTGIVTLPHAITMRPGFGGRIQVTQRGGTPAVFKSPDVAAAHALHLHDTAEIEHGADHEHLHGRRLDELANARRAAILAGHLGDADHVDALSRGLRSERGQRRTPVEKVPSGAYSKRELEAYRNRFGGRGEGPGLARFFQEPHESPAKLPPTSKLADRRQPMLDGDRLHTGYGVFHLEPKPGTAGMFDLHHDGSNLGTLGNGARSRKALMALHDDAMVRHVLSKGTRKDAVLGQMRPPGGARFQHDVRDGKPVVTEHGKTFAPAYSHSHAIVTANKLNAETGSPPYTPELRPGDVGDFEHHQEEHGLTSFKVTGVGKLDSTGDEYDHMPYTVGKGTAIADANPPIPYSAWPKESEWWLLANGEVMDPDSGGIVGRHEYAGRRKS